MLCKELYVYYYTIFCFQKGNALINLFCIEYPLNYIQRNLLLIVAYVENKRLDWRQDKRYFTAYLSHYVHKTNKCFALTIPID